MARPLRESGRGAIMSKRIADITVEDIAKTASQGVKYALYISLGIVFVPLFIFAWIFDPVFFFVMLIITVGLGLATRKLIKFIVKRDRAKRKEMLIKRGLRK